MELIRAIGKRYADRLARLIAENRAEELRGQGDE
jgi:hypothetical protein